MNQDFYGGMAIGFHGCAEQADGLFETITDCLYAGESAIIRGPFRVGKTRLLYRLADRFGIKPDPEPEHRPGLMFIDEAGILPADFWKLPAGMQVCATLPDSASLPATFKGRYFRLDAYRPRPEKVWQTEMPSEGRWLVSVHPDQRTKWLRSVTRWPVDADFYVGNIVIHGVGFQIDDEIMGLLAGALWQRRPEIADPFACPDGS